MLLLQVLEISGNGWYNTIVGLVLITPMLSGRLGSEVLFDESLLLQGAGSARLIRSPSACLTLIVLGMHKRREVSPRKVRLRYDRVLLLRLLRTFLGRGISELCKLTPVKQVSRAFDVARMFSRTKAALADTVQYCTGTLLAFRVPNNTVGSSSREAVILSEGGPFLHLLAKNSCS